jgi:hypothetical protein
LHCICTSNATYTKKYQVDTEFAEKSEVLKCINICLIDPNAAEPWNEWWVRLELQKNTNQQLEQQRKWLELELEAANEKVAGAISEAMNFDLDSLSEVII